MNSAKSMQSLSPGRSTQSNAPTRQADVPAAIEDLERKVNRLNEAVQNLWGRLDSVIRHEPTEEKLTNSPSFGECHISRAIRTESHRIEDLTIGLERMIELIEA